MLRAFSDLLSRAFLRADDFVARYGGEEFAILLFVNDAGQVERLVEALFERLRALRVQDLGEDDMLSCSGGYALLRLGEDGRQFLHRADRALYQAKAAGRACLQAGQGWLRASTFGRAQDVHLLTNAEPVPPQVAVGWCSDRAPRPPPKCATAVCPGCRAWARSGHRSAPARRPRALATHRQMADQPGH